MVAVRKLIYYIIYLILKWYVLIVSTLKSLCQKIIYIYTPNSPFGNYMFPSPGWEIFSLKTNQVYNYRSSIRQLRMRDKRALQAWHCFHFQKSVRPKIENYFWKVLLQRTNAKKNLKLNLFNIYIFFFAILFSGAGIVSGTLHPAVWDTHISSS